MGCELARPIRVQLLVSDAHHVCRHASTDKMPCLWVCRDTSLLHQGTQRPVTLTQVVPKTRQCAVCALVLDQARHIPNIHTYSCATNTVASAVAYQMRASSLPELCRDAFASPSPDSNAVTSSLAQGETQDPRVPGQVSTHTTLPLWLLLLVLTCS
mgnify:CR=1 FL=1